MKETEVINQTIENESNENNVILDNIINKISNNDFKIYFYCPPMNTPSGGVGVIFKQAQILKANGYNPVIVYEPRLDSKASYVESQKKSKKVEIYEKFIPSWVGGDEKNLTFQCLGSGEIRFTDNTVQKCEPLTINPEDFVIIPEGFPNVMEKVSQIPCKKIVFAQSWYYILNSLNVNQNWFQFGIRDVISISDGITEYLTAIMPGLNIKQYSQSINRELFKPKSITDKYPKIGFMPGRSTEAILKTYNVIKTFYCFYPQYKWVRFDELKGLDKELFAERVAECSMILYTDEIAGFGTFPLEAMASGTHVVGWTPLGGKEYMNTDNGFWAHNGEVFQLAELLGVAMERFMGGLLDEPAIQQEYEKTLEKYTEENEKTSINNIYNEFKNERIAELQQLKQ